MSVVHEFLNLPAWIFSAVAIITTLTADRIWIGGFWSTLSIIGIFILKVLLLHILTSFCLLTSHVDLFEWATITPLTNLQEAALSMILN